MPELPTRPGARTAKCPTCPAELAVGQQGARIKHNADGSHTFTRPTPPRKATDPKPRGRRRG